MLEGKRGLGSQACTVHFSKLYRQASDSPETKIEAKYGQLNFAVMNVQSY